MLEGHLAVILLFDVFLEEMTHLTIRIRSIIIMQGEQPLVQGRLVRLEKSTCLLGQPDVISIKQIKITHSLFSHKKSEEVQENYINGLVFPTTAHFSSFISSRYRIKDPNKQHIKAKLLMFDAYSEKDVQIQISIPGSMEVKSFSLKGQPLTFSSTDYEGAYYSSFLRSLRPMNFPGIVLYPLMNRIQILRAVVKNLINFSLKHELRKMDYDLDIFHRKWYEGQSEPNLSLEILIDYCLQNNFNNILKIILEELRRYKSQKYTDLALECYLKEKQYADVIFQTAEKLLIHGHVNHFKEYQMKALFALGRYKEVTFIGKTIIQSGGTSSSVLSMHLHSLIQLKEDHLFLKTLNLIYNLTEPEQISWKQVTHIPSNTKTLDLAHYVTKQKCISEYPELCFPFDNHFLNRLASYQSHKALLQKNSKEGFTFSMLQRIQHCLNNNPPFYDKVIYYIKQRGWNNLVRYRTECFWLESDFLQQEQEIKNSSMVGPDMDRYSFFEGNYEEEEQMEFKEEEIDFEEEERRREEDRRNGKEKNEERRSQPDLHHLEGKVSKDQEDFDGKLSEHQYGKELKILPKCSARIVYTARKTHSNEKKVVSKVQCNITLEQTFFALFNDLKLQNSLQNWMDKLADTENTFSQAKKQIAALILVKKGMINRKMSQNKKCQESFQKARSLSDSFGINLVTCYQLILLYIDNKNVSGVQFYLVQLLKLLKVIGIQSFDIVPEWAKPILQFIVHHEGLSVIKQLCHNARNMHPIFKSVFGLYLRSNFTEDEVGLYVQFKK